MPTEGGSRKIPSPGEGPGQFAADGVPALRISVGVGGRGTRAPALGVGVSTRARRDYSEADYGHPSCQFRCQGSPLELRVWLRPPPPGVEAVLHPSGVWVALRMV